MIFQFPLLSSSDVLHFFENYNFHFFLVIRLTFRKSIYIVLARCYLLFIHFFFFINKLYFIGFCCISNPFFFLFFFIFKVFFLPFTYSIGKCFLTFLKQPSFQVFNFILFFLLFLFVICFYP